MPTNSLCDSVPQREIRSSLNGAVSTRNLQEQLVVTHESFSKTATIRQEACTRFEEHSKNQQGLLATSMRQTWKNEQQVEEKTMHDTTRESMAGTLREQLQHITSYNELRTAPRNITPCSRRLKENTCDSKNACAFSREKVRVSRP